MPIGADRPILGLVRGLRVTATAPARAQEVPPAPPGPECKYALDPLSGPIFGQSNFPDADGVAQTFGFNTDDSGSPYSILHTNAVGGDGFRTMSGVRAFEVPLSLSSTDPATGTGVFISIGISIHDATNNVTLFNVYMKYTDFGGISLIYNNVNTIATYAAGNTPSKVGVYMDAATGKVGITVDGTDYGYQADSPMAGIGTYYLRGVGENNSTNYTNEQFDSGINSEGLTESFPAGALDMCGNAL